MRDKSETTWQEACAIRQAGHANSAATRLYYAVFQAIYAFGAPKGWFAYLPEGLEKKTKHKIAQEILRGYRNCPDYYFGTYKRLLGLRIRADYKPEEVSPDEIDDELVKRAGQIRQRFLDLEAGRTQYA